MQIKPQGNITLHLSKWLLSINQQTTAGEDGRKWNTHALLVGMKTGAAIVESSMEGPQKYKMDLPYDPAITLLGIHPKKSKTLIKKNLGTPMFTAVLFTMAKIWKQPKYPSVNEWIKKAVVHLHNGILMEY